MAAPTQSLPTSTIESNQLILKLIFLVITALFAVMTGIGGWTASYLISHFDTVAIQVGEVKTDIAVEKAVQTQRDARLTNIETFIYSGPKPKKPE